MNDEKRYLLKVLSILLQYPDDECILSLQELKDAVAQIPQTEQREKCKRFVDYLGNNPLIRLQEEYTATFDLNPETCLNISYHKWGDSRERGNALVKFRRLYLQAGYENSTGELPDYLPLVLEYLSLNRNGDYCSFIGQYCKEVETVRSRLEESGNIYADLLTIVEDFFSEMKTMGA